MPPKKQKSAPNQHDKRHENGLAPPGKRVTKQRSNGQLNGHVKGKPTSAVPPPQLPSTGLNQGLKFPRPTDNTGEHAFAPVTRDHATATEAYSRDRTSSDVSLEDFGGYGDLVMDNSHSQISPPAADGLVPSHKYGSGQAGSTVSTVSTILAYYPLRDAISILILLLSLPPTLVLIVQTLFASLTFVPPTAGLSLSTLPNLKDIFNTTTIAAPALWTVLMVDIIIGLIWMVVWKPVQNIFLDMSQAAIAVSLSGAAASAGGPTYSIATSAIIVCVVHVLRYRAIHLTALDYLRSVLHKMDIAIPIDAPSYFSSFHFVPSSERGWIFTTLRTILGIHIVSQGVTTCVRYSLVQNKKDQASSTTPKTDHEATAGSETTSRSHTDISTQHSSASSSEGRHSSSPAARESRPRESSAKKKRKLANQARSQQPLWAAIASTKVTFVKEVEQRETASDGREVAAMGNKVHNTITTINNITNNRIWICEVRDTEILFRADLSLGASAECVDATGDCNSLAACIDKSKPFYARINGATWASTRIEHASVGEEVDHSSDHFAGEIFDLAPLSSYRCELVSIASNTVLCSASLITQPAPSAEQAASVSPQALPHALRPSSPVTTLRQSIFSAEAKLHEVRNRLRKGKKDQRNAHTEINKDIAGNRGKVETSGGNDDRQKQRLQQLTSHKDSAEATVIKLKVEIEALGEIPADELAEAESAKRLWQAASDTRSAALRDVEDAKAEEERELKVIEADIAGTDNKKERLTARVAQKQQEIEALNAKQLADEAVKQQRAQEMQDRERQAKELQYQISRMEAETQSSIEKGQEAWRQLAALTGWPMPAPALQSYPSPPTAEGALSALANGSASPHAGVFPAGAYGPVTFQTHSNALQNSSSGGYNAHGAPRGRSSSMLSQYSGFTDDEDFVAPSIEPRQQHGWLSTQAGSSSMFFHNAVTPGDEQCNGNTVVDGEGSGNGGSLTNGSTNGSNSPRPEAKPFIPTGTSGTTTPAMHPAGAIGTPGSGARRLPASPTVAHAGAVGDADSLR